MFSRYISGMNEFKVGGLFKKAELREGNDGRPYAIMTISRQQYMGKERGNEWETYSFFISDESGLQRAQNIPHNADCIVEGELRSSRDEKGHSVLKTRVTRIYYNSDAMKASSEEIFDGEESSQGKRGSAKRRRSGAAPTRAAEQTEGRRQRQDEELDDVQDFAQNVDDDDDWGLLASFDL